jgi:ribonuclease E
VSAAEEPAPVVAKAPRDEPAPGAADELSRSTLAAREPEAESIPESDEQSAAPAEPAPAVPEIAAAPAAQPVASAGRVSNDPRSAPSPITGLEVASVQSEVPVSGFIDTSRPAPLSADRPSLPRPANDPRRARGQDPELQSGETAR